MNKKPIILKNCPKSYTRDLDKAISPEETIKNVENTLGKTNLDIVAGAKRIDNGRLGIPVYLGICGADARAIMPARKQMGKGSSPAQAKASALMELMERFAFFSFWQRPDLGIKAAWTKASELFGEQLIPLKEILLSVHDPLDEPTASILMDLLEWQFYPATRLRDGAIIWLPLDWFKLLGEFNGSSAGNTNEESLLQGVSELIERHVCCIVDKNRPELPTINLQSIDDEVLQGLINSFKNNNVQLLLKDISLNMPLPTIAALAWDPNTFPDSSEIVFTAGTASSPIKAAIRAITEVAQLAGDFCSNACYEASGLPKFANLEECKWLFSGPLVDLNTLPSVEDNDIYIELQKTLRALLPIEVYGVETTNPAANIPAHYCIAPGLEFRERDRNQSLGLFIGRKLAEEAEPEQAAKGLEILGRLCPNAHYLPFFQGMLLLRSGEIEQAYNYFQKAIPQQPDAEAKAMAAFYAAYALTMMEQWAQAIPLLKDAVNLCPQMKEYINLLGVSLFKIQKYAEAESWFDSALKVDKGSAIDLANRGLCRKFQGKNKEALEDLANALELDQTLAFAKKHLNELKTDFN